MALARWSGNRTGYHSRITHGGWPHAYAVTAGASAVPIGTAGAQWDP
jgi:hypothetical protein